jgi:DNA-binding beta-propeller fold protein YncE
MYVTNIDDDTISVINLCPRPQPQQQNTNDIITKTVNNNNDHTIIKNLIEQKDATTKDITTNKNIIEQTEEQKLAEEQKIQKSNIMSPPSLP